MVGRLGGPSAPIKGELTAFDGMLYTLLPSPDGCMRSTNSGATWSDYNTGFGVVDASAQEEFLVAGNTLYCAALFDLYSITATGNGIAGERSAPLSVFPSTFEDGFNIRNNYVDGHLVLMDLAGRTVRSVRVLPGADQWIEREGLPAGAYPVFVLDRRSGERTALGTLIAQ